MTPVFEKNGAAYIRSLIAAAKAEGRTEVMLSGNYEISETVFLPSDTTLVLADCHLILADGVFCQMFRNEHSEPNVEQDGNNPDRNIRILGRGRAILDGGNHNGLSEKTHAKNGMPHVSQNNMILFCNVEGFAIEDIQIKRQRWWSINLLYCRHGQLKNIDFEANYDRVGENGEIIHKLDRALYDATCVKNADGIDLRCGCHDILIENITGFTEDDSIALTGLYGSSEKMYHAAGLSSDIYNVIIRNIRTAAYCTQVRMLNQSGVKLYNILVDGVYDASGENCRYFTGRGVSSVRVGDERLYGTRHSTADETYNIHVRNVFSRAEYALRFAGSMTNMTYDNINGFDGCPSLVEDLSIKA